MLADSQRKRLVVLISGSGSNLQAIIDACSNGQLDAEVSCVISNRADAYGLQRARDAGIETLVIDHKAFETREQFDKELAALTANFNPHLVILAGFMRILSPVFVTAFAGKLMNIHPSLLPKYPGLNTHQRAIDASDSEAGATVHFVTEELDGGPPIIQASVPVQTGDDAGSLAQRVLEKEHLIYVEAIAWFVNDRLTLDNNGKAILDGTVLPDNGFQFTG